MRDHLEHVRWFGIVCLISGALMFVLLGASCLANGFTFIMPSYTRACHSATQHALTISVFMVVAGAGCIALVKYIIHQADKNQFDSEEQ